MHEHLFHPVLERDGRAWTPDARPRQLHADRARGVVEAFVEDVPAILLYGRSHLAYSSSSVHGHENKHKIVHRMSPTSRLWLKYDHASVRFNTAAPNGGQHEREEGVALEKNKPARYGTATFPREPHVVPNVRISTAPKVTLRSLRVTTCSSVLFLFLSILEPSR